MIRGLNINYEQVFISSNYVSIFKIQFGFTWREKYIKFVVLRFFNLYINLKVAKSASSDLFKQKKKQLFFSQNYRVRFFSASDCLIFSSFMTSYFQQHEILFFKKSNSQPNHILHITKYYIWWWKDLFSEFKISNITDIVLVFKARLKNIFYNKFGNNQIFKEEINAIWETIQLHCIDI